MLTTPTSTRILSWTFGALTLISVLAWWAGWLSNVYAVNFAFGFFILGELCSIHGLLLARAEQSNGERNADDATKTRPADEPHKKARSVMRQPA